MGHDSTTPYATPQSDVQTDKEKYLEVIPAGNWKRFFNFIVDYIGMYIAIFIIAIVFAFAGGGEILLRLESISPIEEFMFGSICYLVYYLLLESIFGRTVGKLITGTAVVNEHGGKPTFKQIIGRTLCRLIPFEPLSFFGAKGYGWHDSIPNTYVIDTRKQKK